MPQLTKYLINTDVYGFEADPGEFEKFLNYLKPMFGNLLEYERYDEKPNLFDVSVPSDTNLFMLGILWSKFNDTDKAAIGIDLDEEDY